MTHSNRLSEELQKWFSVHKRDLPWRDTTDPYPIWLSEIILQQTRVDQGLPYYLKFLDRFPKVEDLASANLNEVLKLWQGLGYYSRARNLHMAAKQIMELGSFPDTFEEIKNLKGVGDYTAAAIASFAFGGKHAVLDGNVFRVLSRVYGISTPINTTEGKKEFQKTANKSLDPKSPGNHNQAIMEFGALQCTPKAPKCSDCPVESFCIARKEGMVELLPVKEKKVKVKVMAIHYGVIKCGDYTVLQQRSAHGIWRSLYEFPCIQETDTSTAKNYPFRLINELGLSEKNCVMKSSPRKFRHLLTHRKIDAFFWEIVVPESNMSHINSFQKCRIDELEKFPIHRLMEKYLEHSEFLW